VASVLVVDDDLALRELVTLWLRREGFSVREAQDGREALALLDSETVDIAIVDVMMPHLDGWELCRAIREGAGPPVLMLTARGETADKVRGLSLGADDYVVKPFDPPELVARVRAVLRRYRINTAQTATIGAVVLDRAAHRATVDGRDVALPPKEFELLFVLATYPGQTLSRDRLIEEIWGYAYDGDERTVDVHVGRLRARFPETASGFRIRGVRGLGYRLELAP
jgi:two-component system, OmpR family, response regulator